jgi:hypothetical protein
MFDPAGRQKEYDTMKAKVTDLKPRQLKTVEALASCGDVTEAAQKAGVSRETVYRWLRQPAFREAVDKATGEAVAELGRGLVALGEKAKRVLSETMDNDNPSAAATRIRAADIVFSRLLQLRELVSLEERVAALEAARNDARKAN